MVGMRKRNLGTIDLDTGELIEGVYATSTTQYNPYGEGFFMTALYGSRFLARDKAITGVAQRVFRELESHLDYENWVRLALVDIAKDLELHRSQVSKAVKILVEKGLLLKGSKIGHFYTYRLNPEFCWRGNTRLQPAAVSEIPSSEYTDFRRACLAEDAEKQRLKQGLEGLSGGKKVIDFRKEQQRRKKITQFAEKLASHIDFDVINLDDVDINAIGELLKKNGTK